MSELSPSLLRVIAKGVDSASARMAKLSHTKWLLETVSIREFGSSEAVPSLAAGKAEGYGVIFGVNGDVFFVFLTAPSVASVSRAFMGPAYTVESEGDAIAEIANIVVSAVADAIGDATGRITILTVPNVVRGSGSSVVTSAMGCFQSHGRPIPIVSQVHMTAEGLAADCALVLLMTDDVRSRL